MAGFKTHISVSAVLGAAVGATGAWYWQLDWGPVVLAAGLTALAGMLPDLDSDSGVPVQPYRVGGSVNYPNAIKRARGRVPVQTRIVSSSRRLWTPAQLARAFPLVALLVIRLLVLLLCAAALIVLGPRAS